MARSRARHRRTPSPVTGGDIRAERRTATLHRSGGSLSVVIPRRWLQDLGIEDKVDLIRSDEGILVVPPQEEASIEDEPEFAIFLNYLLKDALEHPEKLGDVGELLAEGEGLFDGIETD